MKNNDENRSEFQQIMDKLEDIEAMLRKMSVQKEGFNREELLDNGDICVLLGITKRTLQRYRQKGVIPYYMMRGKPYYKVEEVQECLKRIMKTGNK